MFRKGHRLFSIAALGLLVVSIMQAVNHFSTPPDDLITSGLLLAMQAYRQELAPGNPSMMDIHEGHSLTVAIMLFWVAGMNLMISRYSNLRDKLMRRVCTLNLVVVGALVVLFSMYQMLVPAISLGIVEVLFFITRYRLRRSRKIRSPSTGMGPPTTGMGPGSGMGPNSGMPPPSN